MLTSVFVFYMYIILEKHLLCSRVIHLFKLLIFLSGPPLDTPPSLFCTLTSWDWAHAKGHNDGCISTSPVKRAKPTINAAHQCWTTLTRTWPPDYFQPISHTPSCCAAINTPEHQKLWLKIDSNKQAIYSGLRNVCSELQSPAAGGNDWAVFQKWNYTFAHLCFCRNQWVSGLRATNWLLKSSIERKAEPPLVLVLSSKCWQCIASLIL